MREKNKLLDETTWRIIREAKGIAGWVAVSAVLGILAVLCAIAAPEILGNLIQKLYDFGLSDRQTSIRDTLVSGLILLTAVYAAQSLFRYLNMQLMNRAVSRHFTYGLRIAISDKIRRLPVKYVDQTPVGDILNRMIDDVGEMGGYIHQIFDVMVEGAFQIAMITVAMFLENGVLACLVIVLTPISLWISSKIAGVCGKYYDECFEKAGELTEIVEESFTNFATAKAYNLEEYTAQNHAVVNEQLRKATAKANFTGSIVQPLIKFANAMAYICINLIGGWLIVRRGVGVGTVVTIVLFARQFSSPLEQIAMGFANLSHVKACAKRVFRLLDMEEEEQPEGVLPQPCQGEVVFDHAAFSYSNGEPLIESLNLSVHPGQRVAIVGPTGAGKTTIVNLLMRFYDVDGGKILLDGQDIRTLSRDEVRRNFGMVLQDTWLFRGTIAQNVAYGKPDAARQEIEQACREAYCDHFIRTMPGGYDTLISEDTTNLSGGQKQLLTIARALLAGRPLLILDEATSNVDTRTEILVQKAMDKLMKGRTCFVIAHRLSTIVDADLILVLNHGRIVEQGTHGQLLAKKGFYYDLYTSQYAV